MTYYHGSIAEGLAELRPFASPYAAQPGERVYLTARRQVALFYIWDFYKLPIRTPMIDIREDKVVFQEMYSGALASFYRGLSGFVYQCEGDFEELPGLASCAFSRSAVPVTGVEAIGDVYEEILSYEKEGAFVYERYEELPDWRHDVIRGHVMREIRREDLLRRSDHPHAALFREKYPKYWKEAEVLDRHGLL